MAPPSSPARVFFFVPNLIGYLRVGLTIYSLAIALNAEQYTTSVLCYALSFVCDYFDGFFARLCDQCASAHTSCALPMALADDGFFYAAGSSFGAVLDMVTDR